MSDEKKKMPEAVYARYCEQYGYWDFDAESFSDGGCVVKGCKCLHCLCECPEVRVKVERL